MQFAAYKQFCDDTTVEKQRAIKEANEMIEVLKELSGWCLQDLGAKSNRRKIETMVTVHVRCRPGHTRVDGDEDVCAACPVGTHGLAGLLDHEDASMKADYGTRVQLAAFLVQEERDRHAPVALARNAPVRPIGDHCCQPRLDRKSVV